MAIHECPDCEKQFKGRRCPKCGYEPTGSSASEPERALDPCSWEGSGPCVFVATIWPTSPGRDTKGRNLRPGFCAWHHETLLMPRLADEFAEFERFVLHRRETCTQFSHHGVGYLWDTLTGQRRAVQHRDVAQPCAAVACWVWDALEREKRAAMWVPPAGLRATSFQDLVRGLSTQFTLGAEHVATL